MPSVWGLCWLPDNQESSDNDRFPSPMDKTVDTPTWETDRCERERCNRQMRRPTCERNRLHVLTHLSMSTCRVICLNLRSEVKEFLMMLVDCFCYDYWLLKTVWLRGVYCLIACTTCAMMHCVVLNYYPLHIPWCPWTVWGYWVWVSGRPTLLSLTAFRTRSSLHVWTNWSGLKSVRKHFPKDAAWWTEHGTGGLYSKPTSVYTMITDQMTQCLTLNRDFWVLESYSWPAASTHCRTASPSMLCSLISLRYSSAFWLDFYTHEIKNTMILTHADRYRYRQTDRQVVTSYSRWASSSRAPGAMDAILKMSWQTRGTSWSSSWLVELMTRTPSSSPTKTHGSSMGNLRSRVKVHTGETSSAQQQLKWNIHLEHLKRL